MNAKKSSNRAKLIHRRAHAALIAGTTALTVAWAIGAGYAAATANTGVLGLSEHRAVVIASDRPTRWFLKQPVAFPLLRTDS